MDNVKDFINKFILPEKNIEVNTLKRNIAALKELEDLMEISKAKMEELQVVLKKNDEIQDKDREIKINDILIKKAEIEAKKIQIEELKKQLDNNAKRLKNEEENELVIKTELENETKRFTNLQIALGQNESIKVISDTTHKIEIYKKDKATINDSNRKLLNMIDVAISLKREENSSLTS